MTEVALPANHRLTSVRRFESGPPPELALVEPGESIALTKEEEWVSKKKTEVTNTKQIETRVKRQVVLEDGKIVEDSGPMVTTNTTEDTETQEHHQTELRKLGEDEVDKPLAVEGTNSEAGKRSWMVTANPDGLVREVKEKRVLSREETEEIKETEDVQHFGDITDEAFLAAVQSGRKDIRQVLRSNDRGKSVVSTGPRLVHESIKSKKVIDTEDKHDSSAVQADGKIVTESKRTTEHEEINDEELPEDVPVKDSYLESSERYLKTRDQLDVDYLSNGVHVGHEMRFRTENVEVEKRGDGLDDLDFDSLSARLRRRGTNGVNSQPHRHNRGVEPFESPLDRKEALTGRPIDFDKEEETRKVETSKWLEHHFGSDSKSSKSSIVDDEEQPPKTSFFNVTIKSQPSRNADSDYSREYGTPLRSSPRVYSPQEPERDETSRYFKGISDWSERRQEHNYVTEQRSPISSPINRFHERSSPAISPIEKPQQRSPIPDYRDNDKYRSDSSRDYREERDNRKIFRDVQENRSYRSNYENGYNGRQSPSELYSKVIKNGKIRHDEENGRMEYNGTLTKKRDEDYRGSRENIIRSIDRRVHRSRTPEVVTPIPPHRKRSSEKKREERRHENGYRRTPPRMDGPMEEPPPDYSPPSPVSAQKDDRKAHQKTRFADEQPKTKSGNIIGQSIRKLVGKIRSASAERKAKQKAKRSPSPTYQSGQVIDANIMENGKPPIQRYYLGEDPFAGSIYGRENKYDGVKPARSSRKPREEELRTTSTTLGRFSKSTSRLPSQSDERKSSQTLPRHLSRHEPRLTNKSNSTINVSIINTVSSDAPTKPSRTFKTNLPRSKSFTINEDLEPGRRMYRSTQHINRLNESQTGLKSPGLISSLSRSNLDDYRYRNGNRMYVKKEMCKPLYESDDSRRTRNYDYNDKIRDYGVSSIPINSSSIKSGSNSSDYSETYHTTTRNGDPLRPSVTNTTKTFTKKTIPSKDGRSFETIESSETRSITKSHFRDPIIKYSDSDRRYRGASPVVIEVRNNNYRK